MKRRDLPETGEELRQLSQHMRVARRRRRMTLRALAERTGVSVATLSRLERADPTVAIGTVLQVLSVLGLAKGFSRFVSPENDIEQTLQEVRELRRTKRDLPHFTDEELDF